MWGIQQCTGYVFRGTNLCNQYINEGEHFRCAVEEVQQSKEGRHWAQGGVLFWMGARGGWSEARRTRRSWRQTFDGGATGGFAQDLMGQEGGWCGCRRGLWGGPEAGHNSPSPATAAAPLREEAGGAHLHPLPAAVGWAQCPPSTRLGRGVGQQESGGGVIFFFSLPLCSFFFRFILVRL